MKHLLKNTSLLIAMSGMALLAAPTDAATIFETNINGNASALEGVGAGSETDLTLSAADGGGTIKLTTIGAFNGTNPQTMGMTADGFGVGNDKWGNTNQRWLISFDQNVSFDGIGFTNAGGNGEGLRIESSAWANAVVDDSGQNWTFSSDATQGGFNILGGNGPLFDFSAAGVADVTAGTQITIRHNSGNGGSRMTQFTITPIADVNPIPSPTAALAGLVGLAGLGMRRRRGH